MHGRDEAGSSGEPQPFAKYLCFLIAADKLVLRGVVGHKNCPQDKPDDRHHSGDVKQDIPAIVLEYESSQRIRQGGPKGATHICDGDELAHLCSIRPSGHSKCSTSLLQIWTKYSDPRTF